jgi:hypothetical protein
MPTQPTGVERFQKDGPKDYATLQKVQEAGVPDQKMDIMTGPCRLFVGNVPHTFLENDLRKWFEEVSIIVFYL